MKVGLAVGYIKREKGKQQSSASILCIEYDFI